MLLVAMLFLTPCNREGNIAGDVQSKRNVTGRQIDNSLNSAVTNITDKHRNTQISQYFPSFNEGNFVQKGHNVKKPMLSIKLF